MKQPVAVRDRLIAAGMELFCRRGYDAVSVRELTSHARTNLGAITYHFGSKEALYHATIESLANPFAELIASAAASAGTALDRVEAIVRAALGKHLHRGAPTLILRELANDAPLPLPMSQLMKRNVGTVTSVIIEGQQDGTIRAGDPALLALSVVSQPFYFNIASRGIEQAIGVSRNDRAAWNRIIDHVAYSVRQTIAASPATASPAIVTGDRR